MESYSYTRGVKDKIKVIFIPIVCKNFHSWDIFLSPFEEALVHLVSYSSDTHNPEEGKI